MGGQELDSGALVHFSAASAHSMTICPRAQKSARNGFIHKGKKEKEVLNQMHQLPPCSMESVLSRRW